MWDIGKRSSNDLHGKRFRINRYIVLITFIFIFLHQCSRESTDLSDTLQTALDSFYSAIETGNDEARISLFADDAIMMPNHGPIIQGKAAISNIVRSGEGWTFQIRKRSMVNVHISGNTAYTVNNYEYTYHRTGQAPHWHKTKNVHIWKQNPGGVWNLYVDIWNSDVPINEFHGE